MNESTQVIRDKFHPAISMVHDMAADACITRDPIRVWQLVNEAMKLERIVQKIERMAPGAQ